MNAKESPSASTGFSVPSLVFRCLFCFSASFSFQFRRFSFCFSVPFFFSSASLFLFFRCVSLFFSVQNTFSTQNVFQPKILFSPKHFSAQKSLPVCGSAPPSFLLFFLFHHFFFPSSVFSAYFCFCLALLFVSFLPAFLFFSIHVLPFFLSPKTFFSAQNNSLFSPKQFFSFVRASFSFIWINLHFLQICNKI